MRTSIHVLFVISVCAACGVKGRPQPPVEDSPIGRGRPSYQKATLQLSEPKVDTKGDTEEPTPTPTPRRRQ